MWTYLAILLSISVVLGVFIRRVVLYLKGDDEQEVEKKEEEKQDKGNETVVSKKEKKKARAFYEKGEALLKAGKEDEAIKLFVQALSADKDNIEAQQKLAMLYLQKEMYGAATALFKRLCELTDEAVHYSHLGLALYQQNELDEAKEAYQKAVDLDDSRPQRFISLAQVYRALKQYQGAIIALNKAIEKDPENVEFLLLLGDIFEEMEDLKNFEETFEKLLKLDPENKEVKNRLKKMRKREGEIKKQ